MVDYIEYKGKQYPVRIKYSSVMNAAKEAAAKKMEDLESLTLVLYYGLKSGHQFTGDEMTLTRDDMQWILDEDQAYEMFINLYTKYISDTTGLQKQAIETNVKKNLPLNNT